MELELDGKDDKSDDTPSAWCLTATVGAQGTRAFQPGTTVYCFPPVRGGAYESVKVAGPHRRTGTIVTAVVAASDLETWKAESIVNTEVLAQISPPWDGSEISRGVAEGIVAWKAGGAWPAIELRKWNRQRAHRVVGEGNILSRFRNGILRLLGRQPQE